MWLINVQTRLLEDFTVRRIPRYAILSHTWTDEEVAFQEFLSKDGDTIRKMESKKGFMKIMKTCELATDDGIGYVWIDTCCIDKSSSAELSEAINSMWRYYKDAEVCYAYLSDLKLGARVAEGLSACRWFTRGWTLQELIAPKELRFYDETWSFQGTKDEFAKPLYQITKTPPHVLRNPDGLAMLSIVGRMTWASKRETTRIEDTAYCLLGIFDINMPLWYGQGNKAFIRLQQEIIRHSNDLSIFGWCPQDGEEPFIVPELVHGTSAGPCKDDCGHERSDECDFYSVLAPSPKAFAKPSPWDFVPLVEHSVTNRAVKIECSLHRVCLRGCHPTSCRCCSHVRKYVLTTGQHERSSYGVLVNKTSPNAFIRSKKQLVKLSPYQRIWSRRTQRRPIYLLTKAPYISADSVYDVSLDINQVVGDKLVAEQAIPESKWDFAKRGWYFHGDNEWGVVNLRLEHYPACNFYVLFFTLLPRVCILDIDLYKKEVFLLSQSTSTASSTPIVNLDLYDNSKWCSEKDFHVDGRVVRMQVELLLREEKNSLVVYTEGNIGRSHVQLVLHWFLFRCSCRIIPQSIQAFIV